MATSSCAPSCTCASRFVALIGSNAVSLTLGALLRILGLGNAADAIEILSIGYILAVYEDKEGALTRTEQSTTSFPPTSWPTKHSTRV